MSQKLAVTHATCFCPATGCVEYLEFADRDVEFEETLAHYCTLCTEVGNIFVC